MVERCVRDAEVACSNHVTPIKEVNPIRWVHLFSFVVIIQTRSLKVMGADVALFPEMFSDGYYLPQDEEELKKLAALRTRAYENMVAVATCNYPEGQPDCNGRSTLFDGVPWVRGSGTRDMCVFEAPREAGVYVGELDLDQLRAHRNGDIMGDKYRHPEGYSILSDVNAKGVIGGGFVPW